MNKFDIKIAKGESKNLIFKIKTDAFVETDKLLFAMKTVPEAKDFVLDKMENVIDLVISEGNYQMIVPFNTKFTRSLILNRTYYYDLTLIDAIGEEKPLMKQPGTIKIVVSVGASIEKVGG